MKEDLLAKIKERWQTITISTFMVVAVVFSVSVFIPAKYSSLTKMIIIQNHKSEEVDAFSAAKSAEYLSDIIANVVFTESFFQDVQDSPFEIERRFSFSPEKKMKAWEKTLDIKKENNTGILEMEVLDRSQVEAEKIAQSVAWALNVRGNKYHGGGDSIRIQTIDGPITSEKPALPNIWLNSLLALIIGLIGSVLLVHFFDDFKLVLFSKRESDFNGYFSKKNKEGSTEKIALKLEKIRENLRKQKTSALKAQQYPIEESESQDEEKGLDEVEEAFKKESALAGDLENKKVLESEEEEYVRVIENEDKKDKSEEKDQKKIFRGGTKKGEAPTNLPIFGDKSESKFEKKDKPKAKKEKGFIPLEELSREAEKMGLIPNQTVQDTVPNQTAQDTVSNQTVQDTAGDKATKYEASSQEVKERLNKLLRGEL